MYANAEGVPQNYVQAARWYRKAAEQGLAAAQYNLGVMYAEGNGVPQDYAEAVKWNSRAAEQGAAIAQGPLGRTTSRHTNGRIWRSRASRRRRVWAAKRRSGSATRSNTG